MSKEVREYSGLFHFAVTTIRRTPCCVSGSLKTCLAFKWAEGVEELLNRDRKANGFRTKRRLIPYATEELCCRCAHSQYSIVQHNQPLNSKSPTVHCVHLSRLALLAISLAPQAKQEATACLPAIRPCSATRQVRNVGIPCQHLRNILLRLDSSNHDETITTLRHSLGDCVRSLGLTLSPDDISLPLLLRLLDDKSRALSFLLGDLLLLDGLGEFLAEGHVCDGNILEGDVEFVGALEQVGADLVRHGFTLRDEFGGVKLRDDGFKDFVSDGGEDTLVIVETEVLVGVSLPLPRTIFRTALQLLTELVNMHAPGRSWAAA